MAGPKCDADGCKKAATWIRVPRGGWRYQSGPDALSVDAEFYCDEHAFNFLAAKFPKKVVLLGSATSEEA
jgi:hypothetical protein